MKILVTGANGQLAWELSQIYNKEKKFEFKFYTREDWDICNFELSTSILNQEKADYLINAAAYTFVDRAESERDLCFQINCHAPISLANICKRNQTKFIFLSTDYVFNNSGNIPILEQQSKNPKGVYANSKSIAEDEILKINPDAIIIRTSWLYSSHGQNFVKSMLRLSETTSSLRIVNDQIGSPTYARDLAITILKMIHFEGEHPTNKLAGFYHYSNAGQCSWFEFATEIFSYLNIKIALHKITTSEFNAIAHRPPFSTLDCTKIKELLRLHIPPWKLSLHNCLDLLTKNNT
ncbi:MAG: dTDP-4-dehydrorhamnose reductase [Saprospiraceae bacterium]